MTRKTYLALTWDHPRGYNALAAAAERLPADGPLAIEWDRQPLEGFESHPIEDLCARYDMVVLDHPHIGEALAQNSLVPIDTLLPPETLAEIERGAIGASLESYRYEGRLWALPLDAATQVGAMRDDLAAEAPQSWDDVEALSQGGKVALSVAGPHALLSFGSLCVAFGEKPGIASPDEYVSSRTGISALDAFATLYGRAPKTSLPLNPIGLLGLMADSDDVAYCPLVYGYVNYAASRQSSRKRVAFVDAPAGPGGIGSTLGGTGLAISSRAEVSPSLIDHIVWLMSPEAQTGFIPQNDGQPSLRVAWHDADVNAQWGNFYRNTARTLEAAWVRPRFDGYIAFQSKASALLRDAFENGRAHAAVLDDVNDLYRAHRPEGAAL